MRTAVTMLNLFRLVGAAVMLLGVCVPPALAQRAAGPYAGLFGADDAEGRGQSLTLRGALFGVADDVRRTDGSGASDVPYLRDGIATGANGSLVYDRQWRSKAFMASGSSGVRAYGTSSDLIAATHAAATAFRSDLGRRVTFDAKGQWMYSPYYQLDPLANVGIVGADPLVGQFDAAMAAQRNTTSTVELGVRSDLTRRLSATVSARGHEQRFLAAGPGTLRGWGGAARLSYQLSRGLGLNAGYGLDETRYLGDGTSRYRNETIDVGLTYNDTLSFARRTSLSFGTSTSAVRYPAQTHYRLNGNARFNRGFGRTGAVWASYTRDTQFAALFREPLLTDAVAVGMSAQRGRRTHWSTGVEYRHGTVGFTDSSGFSTYSGTARLDVALARRLGLFGQYTYYRYDVPSQPTVLSLVSRSARQSAVIGLSVWVPILNERSLSDPR